MTNIPVLITKDDVLSIIHPILEKEDNVGWMAKVESGKNMYDSLIDESDILISSIVARETLKDDLICFIFAIKKADAESTADAYNKLIELAKQKIVAKQQEIQEEFIASLLMPDNHFSTHGLAGQSRRYQKPPQSEEVKAFKAMSQPAPEGTVSELAERYGKSKSEIRKLKRDGQLHTLELS